jgi:hypothetical protein
MKPSAIINLHGFGKPSREIGPDDDPSWRYWLPWEKLDDIIELAKKHKLHVTIDDGEESTEWAALQLQGQEVPVCIYLISQRIGKPGYLSADQVKELAKRGIKVGSHGLDHQRLPLLAPEKLHEELALSRRMIENMIGCTVASFAIPFGEYNGIVIKAIKMHYEKAYSSDGLAALSESVWPTPRITVERDTDLTALSQQIEAHSIYARCKATARVVAKRSPLYHIMGYVINRDRQSLDLANNKESLRKRLRF